MNAYKYILPPNKMSPFYADEVVTITKNTAADTVTIHRVNGEDIVVSPDFFEMSFEIL